VVRRWKSFSEYLRVRLIVLELIVWGRVWEKRELRKFWGVKFGESAYECTINGLETRPKITSYCPHTKL
jgi:hypothetical protein